MPGVKTGCLSTGFEPFDRDHARVESRLGAVVSALSASDRAEAAAALDEFARTCAEHFAAEERVMAETAYGELRRHKEAHDLFLANVSELSGELATEGVTPDLRRRVAGRVVEWFHFHVSANDVALGAYLAGRRRPQAARDAGAREVTTPRAARR